MNIQAKLITGISILLLFYNSKESTECAQYLPNYRMQDSFYTYAPASADGTGKFYMGREIAAMIGPGGMAWLERSSRPEQENTDLAIRRMNFKKSDVVADIGAGSGYYSFKLAEKVPQGKVYAVEIQDEMIRFLNEKKERQKVNNIEIIKGAEKTPNLPENSIDVALMVDVYHELEFPREMLQAIRKSLKKNGRFILMEYKGEDPEIRIRPLHKTTVVQLKKELGANGFRLESRGDFLPIQHFLTFVKE